MRDEGGLLAMLKYIERLLLDSKLVQPSGGDGIVAYRYETNNEWDCIVEPTKHYSHRPDAQVRMTCTFTAKDQPNPDVAFEADVYANGQRIDRASGGNQSYSVYVSSFNKQTEPDVEDSKFITNVTILVTCEKGTKIQVKVRATSLCKGKLEVNNESTL